MTCIVGYEFDGKIFMGGDSAATESSNTSQRISKSDKVFVRGEFLIGYTSSFRMGQLLRFSLNAPRQNEDQDDYEYMCTTFIDAVTDLFKRGNFIRNDSTDGGTFLVGYKNKLYMVEDDFQVSISEDPFESVGCGSQIAVGAMKILHENCSHLNPQQKITKALEAASRFDSAVRGPFIII